MTPAERADKIVFPYLSLLGERLGAHLKSSVAEALAEARLSGITDMEWPEPKPANLCPSCREPHTGTGLCEPCCQKVADGITEDGRTGNEQAESEDEP